MNAIEGFVRRQLDDLDQLKLPKGTRGGCYTVAYTRG